MNELLSRGMSSSRQVFRVLTNEVPQAAPRSWLILYALPYNKRESPPEDSALQAFRQTCVKPPSIQRERS